MGVGWSNALATAPSQLAKRSHRSLGRMNSTMMHI